jgi:site-specific DNA recombinase
LQSLRYDQNIKEGKAKMTPHRSIPTRLRAVIYCRVSSSQQEDNSSLQTQEEGCRAYATERGWNVAAVYREAHSGVELFERPQLTLLRESMRRREFDMLLVYALDRLSRKQTHQGLILSEAEHAGVEWDSVTEDFDDSPQGQILRAVIGGMAEMERLKIAERTQRGTRARAQSGKLLASGRPLYGYRWRDGSKAAYDLNEATAPVVRRIFDEALSGASLRSITVSLTRDRVPTPTGRAHVWDRATICRILGHPAYAGQAVAYRYKQERRPNGKSMVVRDLCEQIPLPEGTVPPIVMPSEFASVAARLLANRVSSPRNNRNPEATLLRGGFARCGYCGRNLIVQRREGQKHATAAYRCNDGCLGRHNCPKFAISARVLDDAVWDKVTSVLHQPEIIAREVARRQTRNLRAEDLASLDRRLRSIEKQQTNLARGIASLDDPVSAAPLLSELTALGEQAKLLSIERSHVQRRVEIEREDQQQLIDLSQWCQRVSTNLKSLPYDEKRNVLSALGVTAFGYRADHSPRWEIHMAPLPVEPGQIELQSTTGSRVTCSRPSRTRR